MNYNSFKVVTDIVKNEKEGECRKVSVCILKPFENKEWVIKVSDRIPASFLIFTQPSYKIVAASKYKVQECK